MLLDDELSVLLEDVSVLEELVVVVVVLVSELDCSSAEELLTGGTLSVWADEIGSSVEAGGEYSIGSLSLLSEELLSDGVSAVLCTEANTGVDEDVVVETAEDVDDDVSGALGTVAVKRNELLDEDTLPISIMFTELSPALCVSVEQPAITHIDTASNAAAVNLLLISIFPKFSV